MGWLNPSSVRTPLVIINKTTWFSCLRLYFDLYANLIVSVLCGTNNILRAIVLLFCSNFFQSIVSYYYFFNFFQSSCPNFFRSFWCDGKSISFQLYWLVKDSIFDILSRWFSMYWWFNSTVIAYWKQLLSSLFWRFIVALLFINHSGDFIYDLLFLQVVLWRL